MPLFHATEQESSEFWSWQNLGKLQAHTVCDVFKEIEQILSKPTVKTLPLLTPQLAWLFADVRPSIWQKVIYFISSILAIIGK